MVDQWLSLTQVTLKLRKSEPVLTVLQSALWHLKLSPQQPFSGQPLRVSTQTLTHNAGFCVTYVTTGNNRLINNHLIKIYLITCRYRIQLD